MFEQNLNLLTDEELVDLVQERKYTAFRELVARYSGDLFIFCYHFAYDLEKAKKIIEKLFVDLWCQPYSYNKNTKLALYKKAIKFSMKNRLKVSNDFNTKIALSLKKQELLAINLYYFSTLKEKEISLLFNNIKACLDKTNKRLEIGYGINLEELANSLNTNSPLDFDFQKDIIKNSTKYSQKDRYQNFVILLGILPIFALIIMIVYSLLKSDNDELRIKERDIEVLEYIFLKDDEQ